MKNKIIEMVDSFLKEKGILPQKDYIWSLQGPTLIYLGNDNPFKSLTVGDVGRIKEMGAQFLVEP